MRNFTVLIPIHVWGEDEKQYIEKAISSVDECQTNYTNGTINCLVVCASSVYDEITKYFNDTKFKVEVNTLKNEGKTDYCSQINFGAQNVKTDYFSILEFDDVYLPKWFKQVDEYFYGNEDVSVMLPINLVHDVDGTKWQYCNEMVLASSFSTELGFIDFGCLENCTVFNLTGGVFNTQDFINVGMYKPSIDVAFNYELLLRMTSKELKVYVVPKEGYNHVLNRPGSLIERYNKEIEPEDINKYFELAKREYTYTEDRNKTIIKQKDVDLK